MTRAGHLAATAPTVASRGRPAATAEFKPAERDKNMSEQKKSSFMEELDKWTMANVIDPLMYAFAEDEDEEWTKASDRIKTAIRQKVLDSYRNGQAAGPRSVRRERYAQAQAR